MLFLFKQTCQQMQVTARKILNTPLLKGALILFCFRFFLMLVGNTIHVIYANDKAKNITMLLLLPFVKKITELLWGKIFFDEKCIIGELRRNRDTNQITFVV